MKILIVCATPGEAVLNGLNIKPVAGLQTVIPHNRHQVELLVTGAGMVATAFHLGRHLLSNQYDLAVNIGICGAFNSNLLGKVVLITRDRFADLGAEDNDAFMDVFELGLMDVNQFPFTDGWIISDYQLQEKEILALPTVKGISVNKTSGNENNIYKLNRKYNADVESMEGAAFYYCCRMNKLPCIQIRAVSNLIEKRNRSAWKIETALSKLESTINAIIDSL